MMGYKNTGRGEICALIISNAAITKSSSMGMSQILFDLKANVRICFIVSNIVGAVFLVFFF